VPGRSVVTVVGTPSQALPVAQAFAAVPGVSLRLLTPADYRPRYAKSSDLVVLDGWLPSGGLPPSPAVFLVDPPKLVGGHVGPAQADAALSGTDSSATLLSGIDLSSLSIDHGAARDLTLPRWLTPLAWSPSGPLLAAGDDGRQRLAVASFDPGRSDLPQLASFPVLAANLVSWSLGWEPHSGTAGTPILIDAIPGARTATLMHDGAVTDRVKLEGHSATLTASEPGAYVIDERGPGVRHQASIAVNVGAGARTSTTPIDIRAPRAASVSGPSPARAPWFVAAALIVLALEWAYWMLSRRASAR
jgi:hypothetical protein